MNFPFKKLRVIKKYPDFKNSVSSNDESSEDFIKNETLKHQIVTDAYNDKTILLQNKNYPHLDIDLCQFINNINLDKVKNIRIINCVFKTITIPSYAINIQISLTYTDELLSYRSVDSAGNCKLRISNSAIKTIDISRIRGITATVSNARIGQFLLLSDTSVRKVIIDNSYCDRLVLIGQSEQRIIVHHVSIKKTELKALFLKLADVNLFFNSDTSRLGVIHENNGFIKELETDDSSFIQIKDNENYFNRMKAHYDDLKNFITADKYYALEMNARLLSKKATLSGQDKFLYRMSKHTSNFGQDFVQPLLLLLAIMAIAHIFLNINTWDFDNLWKFKFNTRILAHELKEFIFLLNPLDSLFGKFDSFHPGKFFVGVAEIGLLWSVGVAAKRKLRR